MAYLQKARETGQPLWYDEAERSLRASLDYQVNFEALYGLGSLLAARHQFHDALPLAEQAAAAVPGGPEAQGLLFEIHLALGDWERAQQALEAVSPSHRDTFEVSSRWASLAEYRGWPKEALRRIEEACNDARARRLAASTQAWCAVRRGALLLNESCDADGAEQAYEQALRLLPNYYFAREHLAELRAAQGNTAEAIALYEALLNDLSTPVYRLALAEVYEAAKRGENAAYQRAEAQRELQASVESGSREHFREYILLVAERKEHAAEALRLAESEWATRRDAYTADALAWAYFHNGRAQEAVEMAGRAVAPGIKVPALLLRVAGIFAAAERWGEVRDVVSQLPRCSVLLTAGERSTSERIRERLQRVPRIY